MDNSTMSFSADRNVAPLGYNERLLLDDDTIPPYGDDAQVDYAKVLQSQDDLEQLDLERAPELQGPSTSDIVPEFPAVDQSEETIELGEEDGSEEEDQSAERDGQCSHDHIDEPTGGLTLLPKLPSGKKIRVRYHMKNKQWDIDEFTGGLTLLPKLPSGKKIGVSYHKKNKQWHALLQIKADQLHGCNKKGMQICLGSFESEEEAKMAHDRAAIKLKMQSNARGKPYKLNYPVAVHASYMEEHAKWTTRDFLWKIRRTSNKFSKGTSRLKGVTMRTREWMKRGREWVSKYESNISFTAKDNVGDNVKRNVRLGHFESEEAAGQAYDRALLFLHQHLPEVEQLRCITNYRPSTYSASDIEAMASKLQ